MVNKSHPFFSAELCENTQCLVVRKNGVLLHKITPVKTVEEACDLLLKKGFVRNYDWSTMRYKDNIVVHTCMLLGSID